MRRTPIIVLCMTLVLTACGPSVVEAPPPSTPPTVSSATTAPAGTSGIWIDVEGLDALKQQTPPTIPTAMRPESPLDPSALSGGIDIDYEGLKEVFGTTTTTTSTTSIATTTTTVLVLPPEAVTGPDFVWYGAFGLARVEQGVPTVVWDQGPVQWADDDLAGGVLFMLEGQPTLLWQRLGDSDPVEVERESGYWYPAFTASLDGVPTLFYSGMPAQVDLDTWPCPDWALNGYALPTGEESTFVCLPIEDAGFDIYSFGGGRFVGTPYAQCGGDYTYHSIRFWDTSGSEVEVAGNPYPSVDGCAPCELAALISDDGTLLASQYRPDAFWPDSVNYPPGHLCTGDYDGWWEKSQLIPAVVAVADLTTGEEMWSTEVGAEVQLGDFDGRYVVLYRRDWSNHPHVWVDIRIVDTWNEKPDIHIDTPSMVKLIQTETP